MEKDGDYQYVLHGRDHFTKFSLLAALTSKSADEVAAILVGWFTNYGPPSILHCDNGKTKNDKTNKKFFFK